MNDNNLSALESFLNDDALVTPPIKSAKFPDGKVYRIPSPDAETGLRLTGLANIAAKAAQNMTVQNSDVAKLKMDDDEERDFMAQVMGPVRDEMIADGVSWVTIQRMNQYAFAYFAVSPQAAERGVESGAFAGKAPAPANRAERRAKAKSPKSPASPASKSPKKA